MNTIKFDYAKDTSTSAELTKKLNEFRTSQKAPVLSKSEVDTDAPVKGVSLFAKDVAMIHEIAVSTSPLTEAVSNQKVTPEQIIGTLSSSLLTLEFIKMQSAFKKSIDTAKTEAEKKTLDSNWLEGINNFKLAYASIGLPETNEKKMVAFSTELLKNKDAFDSIVNIDNSKQAVKTDVKEKLNSNTVATGRFETQAVTVDDPLVGNLVLPRILCNMPFAQGSFTRHFGQAFNLQVSITLPCITRWNPFPVFGWCRHTYTLANLNYNVDLNIGYRLTCCGGEAWGFASANVCTSFLGHSFCAGCSAGIVGVVGVARTPNGGNCTYGLGITAELRCTFASITVLNISYPFAYVLSAPCPPLPCL